MSPWSSTKTLEVDDREHEIISNCHNLNKILVNDYLSSRIHDVCNVDMKSNTVDLMKTPNLSIFDTNTAYNLGLSFNKI